ncbi:hypothetical protein FISHEDRAFT_32764 [Fistulina hepatica ATCC 64428]|uniref:UbiA prenyltransferase n=1 Tax=Fistulina hepatica ATCC 64428 TaxID=1128425 RepID=A0A0D7AQY2_9AGAR|nr:hypothetical protein FISHEDRAFT_32764 [Fistulina hepatica ATCC 64428]
MLYYLHTVYLFSQSDIMVVVWPILGVSLALVGFTDIVSFATAFLWMELHLITFEIKNQIDGVEEDRLSKPNRPIVSGRITLENAYRLYVVLGVFSVLMSVCYRLTVCSLLYMALMLLYNECGLSRKWYFKSSIAAVAYFCYSWGTTVVLAAGRPMTSTAQIAFAVSGLIHVTSSHAQDFRDRDGDAAMGRRTLPLILPQWAARGSLLVVVAVWTFGLIWLWSPPMLVNVVFVLLDIVVTVKYTKDHSQEADRDSFFWYNAWLAVAHVLPLFQRLREVY